MDSENNASNAGVFDKTDSKKLYLCKKLYLYIVVICTSTFLFPGPECCDGGIEGRVDGHFIQAQTGHERKRCSRKDCQQSAGMFFVALFRLVFAT